VSDLRDRIALVYAQTLWDDDGLGEEAITLYHRDFADRILALPELAPLRDEERALFHRVADTLIVLMPAEFVDTRRAQMLDDAERLVTLGKRGASDE
jgi:hypothetical protein